MIGVHTDLDSIPNPEGLTVLLCMGSAPVEVLGLHKVIPKNRTVTGLRGQVLSLPNTKAKAMVTYSPSIGDINYGYYVDFQCDVSSALRLATTGSLSPKYGDYKYVQDFKEYRKLVEHEIETKGMANSALDLETLGLDPYRLPSNDHPGAYIICIQFTCLAGMSHVVYLGSKAEEEAWLSDLQNVEDLLWLLSDKKIKTRGANLKYDLNWLKRRAGLSCTNFVFDTTLVGSLLDENRSNGLDVHTKIYVPSLGGYSDEFDRTVDKSRMDLVPKAQMLPYAGGDTDATLQVAEAEKSELLKDPHLTRFYVHILHPAARAFEGVEQTGVLVDPKVYADLRDELNTDILQSIARGKQAIGGRLAAKHMDLDKPGGINLTKASLIKDFMFSPSGLNLKPLMFTSGGKDGLGKKEASTALDHLLMFEDNPDAKEFVGVLKDYASATKTQGTYVDGFLKHLRSDGRFHPSFWFFAGNKDEGDGGTVTGRLSAKDPAWQCMVGETEVLCRQGYVRLDDLVNTFKYMPFEVKTHTGAWKTVTDVHYNGTRPVFRVTTASGKQVTCTENHPLFTKSGWVPTLNLSVGQSILTHRIKESDDASIRESGGKSVWSVDGLWQTGQHLSRTVELPLRVRRDNDRAGRQPPIWQHNELRLQVGGEENHSRSQVSEHREDDSDLPVLGGHEEPVHQPQEHKVQLLRGAWNSGVPEVGQVRELLERLGGVSSGLLAGEGFGQWALRAEQLQMDSQVRAKPEQEEFQEEQIICIEYLGSRYTYDISVDSDHSFIANGIVVHNTLPKHTKWAKKLRKAYIAPNGYVIMENDYSQGELRVVACIANEQTMIKSYLANLDLHVVTGSSLAGFTYDQVMAMKKTNPELYDSIRQPAKPANFGLLYGQFPEGFRMYAEANYGVKMTLERAQEIWDAFFKLYPGLTAYHNQYKALAHRHGYVRSPLGRIRHLPLIHSKNTGIRMGAERQAINSVVQSTLTDMMIWAIALQSEAGLAKDCPCFGATHDAEYVYVPEDNVDVWAKKHIEIMEHLPFEQVGWKPQLSFKADCKIGKNLADLKELHFA
jgi:DNA polymerase I-like protein with 3'-5' exonuclease and polymerase domains